MNTITASIAIMFVFIGFRSYNQEVTDCPFVTDEQYDVTYVPVPEVEPEFPGGAAEMITFLRSNIVYPETIDCPAGTLYISFFVMSDGSIDHIHIAKTFDRTFAQEGIRVIEMMPNWIPGKCGNVAVNVKYTIPIIIN